MEVWKMMCLFNWVIFRFHVNFQGCIDVSYSHEDCIAELIQILHPRHV